MAAKTWTTKEIQYIKKSALLAETNHVLNADQMAEKLARSIKSVESKIYKMQKDGDLPSIDRSKAFDAENRPFTPKEDKRLISMIKLGAGYEEIGEALGRNKSSVSGRLWRLRQNGKLKHYSKSTWSDKQVQLIIENIKFDENGFVSNYAELAQLTKKRHTQIQQKISKLRKDGLITVQADRTKTSVKSKQAMDQFNCARFGKRMEDKPVTEKVAETNVKVETQSKVVQMIMTVVVAGNEKTINYFSMEGELLAAKKEAIE
ncbi:helix-turn-helix domain containing protein [Candidatus Enterococcus clewellii]|uniref:Uncharacterized protein n=1 Tax=Candidatus Enterococcus clewellii TaxID=1834193 RepID=A0A242K8Q8_9ENTE|nr:helix-turn-helix domain containing protein [Enterococcus sp. 9E7_DIV0242]OTP17555.1 hypothetical protein A5888_001693 [Enterococcus sp. 9E7_DIV0242]